MKKLPVTAPCRAFLLTLAMAIAIAIGIAVPADAREGKEKSASLETLYRNRGPHEVLTLREEWMDTARDRRVPVKIYYPEKADGSPSPVIIFSHGLGGSRDNYEHLGDHWASHGYVSVHLQHIGSDDSVWREVPPAERRQATQKAANPQSSIDRPHDVRFAIDQLEARNGAPGPLEGRLDLDHIGMSGHSFGARTTLAIAGQIAQLPGGREISSRDPRVTAALPMSPMPPKLEAQLRVAFSKITIPVMHMTGTHDMSSIEPDRTPEERQVPFQRTNAPGQYLIVFNGGDHMIFSGRPRIAGNGESDAAFQELIRLSSTAFWDAYLKEDGRAKKWLVSEKGLRAVLGETASFESK